MRNLLNAIKHTLSNGLDLIKAIAKSTVQSGFLPLLILVCLTAGFVLWLLYQPNGVSWLKYFCLLIVTFSTLNGVITNSIISLLFGFAALLVAAALAYFGVIGWNELLFSIVFVFVAIAGIVGYCTSGGVR